MTQILILNFIIGVVVGALLETVYRSIEHKRLVTPKVANILMYGFMGTFLVFIYFLDTSLVSRLFLLFLIPTLIEFLTGYLYLKIKRVHLWNYSKEKFNFMGLVCLRFSLIWFAISLIYYYLFLPLTL